VIVDQERTPFMSNRTANPCRRGPALSLALALALTALGGRVLGDSADSWLGARVMARASDTRLRVGAEVRATLNAGSAFRVDRVQGEWLWVDAGAVRGWVKRTDVVPADRAVEEFSEAIRRDPSDGHAYLSRGLARHARGDLGGAIEDFTAAVKLDPSAPWAYHDRAVSRYAKGQLDAALADADEAVRLDPAEPSHRAARAGVEFARKDYDRAAADYTEALRLLRGDEAALEDGEAGRPRGRLLAAKWTCARAECWEARHEHDRAAADYAEAVRLDPKDAAAVNSLAWLLATCEDSQFRDGMRAFRLAALACELTGYHDHLCLDTLAAAYAEAGDFAAAVRWQSKALELASGDARFAAGYRARVKLFREGTPYHEGPGR
jgi:tetratricopeptide (TPR) repeat protein